MGTLKLIATEQLSEQQAGVGALIHTGLGSLTDYPALLSKDLTLGPKGTNSIFFSTLPHLSLNPSRHAQPEEFIVSPRLQCHVAL